MAKKIRLDFSKVEERSGWNTRRIPEGLHKAKVVAVQQTEAQDGTPMLVYAFVPTDNKYRTRRFPYYCKLQQNQLWKLRDLLIAGGMSVPKKAQQIDPEKIVGATVAIEVEDDSYNGTTRSSVTGVYSVNVLDDYEERDSDDLDEDLDEDLDDEDFDEDLDEDLDDEDFDEDLDEDLDDEDLDDEDFDDEDLDDEEEVPAKPVKKRNHQKTHKSRK